MKKNLHNEIEEFFEILDGPAIIQMLKDLQPIFELYDVENEEEDWVRLAVAEGEHHQIRLIRTVYLVSKFACFHGGKLSLINIKHKDLWLKMEKESKKMLNKD